MSAPAYNAYTVYKRNGRDDWTQIGVAIRHNSGNGYSIVLKALPLSAPDGSCTIVLRKPSTHKHGEERPSIRKNTKL